MKNWVETTLGDEFEVIMGQSPPSKFYNNEGEGLPFFQGKKEFGDIYPTVESWSTVATKIAEKDDVLLSIRAPIGPVNIAPAKCGIGRGLAAIRPNSKTSAKFIYYLIKSKENELVRRGSGVTFTAITKPNLYSLPILLPDTQEERSQIVEAIETQFTRLDSAINTLEVIKTKLSAFRKSALKNAFSGRITHPEIKPGELPKRWKLRSIGDVLKVVSGNTPKGVNDVYNASGIPFFKVADMNTEGNEIYMKKSKIYLTQNDIQRMKINIFPKGTVIFPKRGGAILTNKKRILCEDSSFDLNLMGIIPNERVDGLFLYYWLLMLDLSSIYDGSNVPQINNKNIEPLEFPVPSIEEQWQVVSEIESRLTVIDKIENIVASVLSRAGRLRSSILKKAFEGKLVKEGV